MQRKKQIHFVAVFLISFLFTITVSLQAQVPRTISFQGLLTNPDGSNLPDGQVSLEFMLYESETGGTAIWTETQSVNIKNSIFSVNLGKVAPLTAAFDKPYWVGIKVNGNSELVPRIALTASPYSLGAGAVVSQPGPGQNFQVKDSSGKVTSTISSNGDTWSAGTGKFATGLVVGDTTVVPDTSSFSTINTNKIKFGNNKTLGTLGSGVGGRVGRTPNIGVFGWAKLGSTGVFGKSESGAGVFGYSKAGEGILGRSPNGWAGRFGPGNVWIEKKLKIDVVPTTTETNYLVWSSDHFVKVNNKLPNVFPDLKVQNPNNDVIVDLSSSGPSDFNSGLRVPVGGGGPPRTFEVDPMGGPSIRDASGTPFWSVDPTTGDVFIGGDLNVLGNMSKPGGDFIIDHPLDPLNKYLKHSFVESPDMMNVYNGNVILDEDGEATMELPEWFEALNKDFRYQLTPIGAPGPNLYVSQKIKDNTFKISGGKAGMEVSWQITGIRHDAYANLNRIKVEEDKPIAERGKYLHPDAYGQSVVDNK